MSERKTITKVEQTRNSLGSLLDQHDLTERTSVEGNPFSRTEPGEVISPDPRIKRYSLELEGEQ